MASFAKLFSCITESSLWSEDQATRIVFVSMLAKANAVGFIEAALPGIARLSNVSLEECERALAILEAPDPHSKDPELFEGRRVRKMPNGWVILKYDDYRNRVNEEERREYIREYMRIYREKHKKETGSNPVNKCKGQSTQAEAEAEAFKTFWSAYPKRVKKQAALKAWRALSPDQELLSVILTALESHKLQAGWKQDHGKFIPHASTWLNGRRWEDEAVEIKTEKSFAP